MDIYILYTPQTWDLGLPFWIGKGSKAALEGATREQRGAVREQEGAKGEHVNETGGSGGAKRRHLS